MGPVGPMGQMGPLGPKGPMEQQYWPEPDNIYVNYKPMHMSSNLLVIFHLGLNGYVDIVDVQPISSLGCSPVGRHRRGGTPYNGGA